MATDIKQTHTAFLYLVAQVGFIMALAVMGDQGGKMGKISTGLIIILWIVFMAVYAVPFSTKLKKLTPGSK